MPDRNGTHAAPGRNGHDSKRWEELGTALIQRRTALGFRSRQAFAEATRCDYRLLYDVERARRTNFGTAVLTSLELAYGLRPGAFATFLAGGDLETAPPAQSHQAPAPADSFAALEEIHPDSRPAVRERLPEVQAMIRTARVHVPEGPLRGAQIFGDGTPEQRFWDQMAAQGSGEAELAVMVAFGWAWDAATKAQSPRNPGLPRAVP